MERKSLGVRKGAWTKEEDVLLRKCIEKYGEGRWHLAPFRAGLNRCRKSCRLRWLNYLRPNIKRGYFTKDEVDLIVRLHKLLGNRWSLIAGRIPGRTANDVKNFWNTHIDKKPPTPAATTGDSCRRKTMIAESKIIRPRPRTFSKKLQPPAHFPRELTITSKQNNPSSSTVPLLVSENESSMNKEPLTDQFAPDEADECMRWWENLLEITENDEEGGDDPFAFPGGDDPVVDPILSPGFSDQARNYDIDDGGLSSLDLDVDVWQHVGMKM
ncbi:hypothetical protein OROHE_002601 [Orobanche hederae]